MGHQSQATVSVVTPFYNTEDYLAECIESVLAQTYADFEYILLDNCSTDGSARIVHDYAARDPRIRYVKADTFVGQVPNYNRAVREISPASRYCKIVQADDWLFPSCLAEMVELADAHPDVGLVGSYSLYGERVGHDVFPAARASVIPGREAVRRYLLDDRGFLGSPTCVMYRSDLVRAREPFYSTTHPCEDIETCLDLLLQSDFGFVGQVLSFNRRDNEGIWTNTIRFDPVLMHQYLLLHRYGPMVLDDQEYQRRLGEIENNYYALLAKMSLQPGGKAFLQFHREGLAGQGLRIDRGRLARRIAWELVGYVANPKMSLGQLVSRLRRKH